MKLKYIFAAGVMALLASCNESRFLDIKPQGTLNDDLLASADGVELLVTSAYAGLKGPNREMHWVPMTNWTYGEVRSDNAYKGGGGVNDGDFCTLLETFKIDATWSNADEKWFQLYCCLQRCNSALRVMNTLDENSLSILKSRKAEMKVIRAHFFFELVRLFKQVPYFDENVENDDYKYIPNNQYTREELLGKIAQEFLDAADDLPDTQSQVGRITKNIAYAYAAKAILYQAYQQDDNNQVVAIDKQLLAEVVTLCDKVGAQGKTYDLLNDFQKLDQLEYENGVESVFAVQYSMDDETDGAGNINWSNLLNAPKGPYGGDGFFLPSQNLINAYKTDTYGLPLFDTFNTDDYGIYEGSELTNVDATVDPRLDFVTGRPGITWKTYTAEPCKANWVRNSGEYGFNCTRLEHEDKESYVSYFTVNAIVGELDFPSSEIFYFQQQQFTFPVDTSMNVEIVENRKALTTVRNKKKELKDLDNHAYQAGSETSSNVVDALDSVDELETDLDQSKESMYKLSYVIRVSAPDLDELKRRCDEDRKSVV